MGKMWERMDPSSTESLNLPDPINHINHWWLMGMLNPSSIHNLHEIHETSWYGISLRTIQKLYKYNVTYYTYTIIYNPIMYVTIHM